MIEHSISKKTFPWKHIGQFKIQIVIKSFQPPEEGFPLRPRRSSYRGLECLLRLNILIENHQFSTLAIRKIIYLKTTGLLKKYQQGFPKQTSSCFGRGPSNTFYKTMRPSVEAQTTQRDLWID